MGLELSNNYMHQYTEEQKQDFKERAEAFDATLKEASEKYQVDLTAVPEFTAGPQGIYAVIVNTKLADKKYAPVPSPMDPGVAPETPASNIAED